MVPRRSIVEGVGAYLPERVLTNDELSSIVETSDEWIRERTGIRERRVADEKEVTSDLATCAAKDALNDAGIDVSEIDLIVLATTTPDRTFPATATAVQANLGITRGAAFDVQAVCSGFLFALATADSLLKQGLFSCALVIGAETFTRLLDWTDRGTCVLFGDGAGGIVLRAAKSDEDQDRGVITHYIRTDGRQSNLLYVDGGVSTTGTVGQVRMLGNRVFKSAVKNISDAIKNVLNETGLTVDEVDWFVPHQANQRILDAVANKLGIEEHKVITTVSKHGNTSAASIPLALHTAVRDGRIKRGDLVISEAMGGGFSWGATAFRM